MTILINSPSAPPPAASPPGRRPVDASLNPLFELARRSPSLLASRLGTARTGFAKFLLLGERGGGAGLKLALLPGTVATDPAYVEALSTLLQRYERQPAKARDFALSVYLPLRLPTRVGRKPAAADLSSAGLSQILRDELRGWSFDGVITFSANPGAREFSVRLRSGVIAAEVARPTLAAVVDVAALPKAVRLVAKADSLGASASGQPAEQTRAFGRPPHPFELELLLPGALPQAQRVAGLLTIVPELLRAYRQMIVHAAHL